MFFLQTRTRTRKHATGANTNTDRVVAVSLSPFVIRRSSFVVRCSLFVAIRSFVRSFVRWSNTVVDGGNAWISIEMGLFHELRLHCIFRCTTLSLCQDKPFFPRMQSALLASTIFYCPALVVQDHPRRNVGLECCATDKAVHDEPKLLRSQRTRSDDPSDRRSAK